MMIEFAAKQAHRSLNELRVRPLEQGLVGEKTKRGDVDVGSGAGYHLVKGR